MKPSLVVMTSGKQEGKVVPIPSAEFHIGRDPQCHLRPTNPVISKRHCILLVRGEQFFVRDLQSTNGTYVNEDRVQGERELIEGDLLKIGPLHFTVKLQHSASVDRQTPLPPSKAPKAADEDLEAAAAELLGADEALPALAEGAPGADGTTVLIGPQTGEPATNGASANSKQKNAKAAASGDTSTAAKALLDRYLSKKGR